MQHQSTDLTSIWRRCLPGHTAPEADGFPTFGANGSSPRLVNALSEWLLSDAGGPWWVRSTSRLRVALVYTDIQAGLKAMEFYASLVRQLNDAFVFHMCFWQLQALRDPQILEAAGEAAAAADIIVCSFNGSGAVPLMTVAWVNYWMARRTQSDGALAVLLQLRQPPRGGLLLADDYLRRVAHLAGLEFFVAA